jgi:DNA-binding HxlR family transcriptional regulator
MSESLQVTEVLERQAIATSPVRLADLLTDGRLPAACPTRVVLDHVTSKWGVLLLLALSEGDLRWGELRRTVEGISEKMLAQTLRTLERDGIVDRTVTATVPPRVDYSLTARGRELVDHLLPLMGWIARNAEAIVSRPVRR